MSFISSFPCFHDFVVHFPQEWEILTKRDDVWLFPYFLFPKLNQTNLRIWLSILDRSWRLIITYAMLERSLGFVISKYLGKYINTVSKEDIQLSLWNGELVLRCIVGKDDCFEAIDGKERVSRLTRSSALRWLRINWFPTIGCSFSALLMRYRSLGLIFTTNRFSSC